MVWIASPRFPILHSSKSGGCAFWMDQMFANGQLSEREGPTVQEFCSGFKQNRVPSNNNPPFIISYVLFKEWELLLQWYFFCVCFPLAREPTLARLLTRLLGINYQYKTQFILAGIMFESRFTLKYVSFVVLAKCTVRQQMERQTVEMQWCNGIIRAYRPPTMSKHPGPFSSPLIRHPF